MENALLKEAKHVHIRLATPDDIPQLSQLLTALFQQEAEFSPHESKQAHALEVLLAEQKSPVLVAERMDEVIGMVSLQCLYSTALDAPVAILEDMIVSAEHRNLAIGSKLIQAAEAWAKENGVKRITLLTDGDNLQAQSFYQKNGFAPSSMVAFRKRLP